MKNSKHLRLLILLKDHCWEDIKTKLATSKHERRFLELQKRIARLRNRHYKQSLAEIDKRYNTKVNQIIQGEIFNHE